MNIGIKIKALRKEQNVTQEKLAEYLNISYQAISKWENGSAYPDITLIIPIAHFFNVSVDYLFDMDSNNNEEKINNILNELSTLRNVGKTTEAINLLRESLTIYPKEYKFMHKLAELLSGYHATDEQERISKEEHYVEQSIKLCERILEDCGDEDIRNSAIRLLCYNYPKVGERDKAISLAKKLPSLYSTGSLLLEHIYEGEECIKQRQQNLKDYVTLASQNLFFSTSMKNLGKELTIFEKIKYLKTSIKMMDLLFYDGIFLFEHIRMLDLNLRLARYYAEVDEVENCFECLIMAKEHAISFENIPVGDYPYTSMFINRLTFNKKTMITNSEISAIESFRNYLSNNCFDKYRNHSEFLALLN